jgi:phosphatidylinositol-3-phosphatase
MRVWAPLASTAIMLRRFVLAILLTAVAIATPISGALATAPEQASGNGSVPALGHVFVIAGENTSLSQITSQHAPYLSSVLKPQAAWLTRYFALTDGSLGDYVGMMSGQFITCEKHNDFSFTNGDVPGQHACHQRVDNLFHQLDMRRISWQEWNESAANSCDIFDHGAIWSKNTYSAHHSPALYFDDIQAHHSSEDVIPSAECREKVLPAGTTAPNDMSTFNSALAAGQVARFNLIIPNDCENGHDTCGTHDAVRQFDDFLAREVPLVEASPAFGSDGTIIVTWDEGADPPKNPKHVLLAVIGGHVKPGVYNKTRYSHYSLLRTLEDGYGISRHLAHAARAHSFLGIWK